MLLAILVGVLVATPFALALPELAVEVGRRVSTEVLFSVDTAEPVVALTLDDGPSAATPEILEVLAEHGARATFFVIGEHVRERPEVARDIVVAGHELAHHMMADGRSISLSPAEFREEFETMDALLDELGGARWFRPGSGWYDNEMLNEASIHGYTLVLGDVYPFDAQIPSPSIASWYVRRGIRPGSIIILHDGDVRGVRTADALRVILPELKRRGVRVVTVSELVAAADARGAAAGALASPASAER